MSPELFLAAAGLAGLAYLAWGFHWLPQERWQVLACLPLTKKGRGRWRGLNITWYGLLVANAQAFAVALLFMLLGSLEVEWPTSAGLLALMLGLCLPGSRWLAQLVEKKSHTFTVGGASFLGLLLAPALPWLASWLPGLGAAGQIPALAWCAAVTCAYALGEGLGRLACLSFGCCYGKPLEECPAWLQRIFARCCFVFEGANKKIAYAGGLEGKKVFPIQALTALVCLGAALGGAYLFLRGDYASALLISSLITQAWRVLSEFLRADYRGGGRLSAYQLMAGGAGLWTLGLAWLLPRAATLPPALEQGLGLFAAAGPLLVVQAAWLFTFFYYGRSRVTTSVLSIQVLQSRI